MRASTAARAAFALAIDCLMARFRLAMAFCWAAIWEGESPMVMVHPRTRARDASSLEPPSRATASSSSFIPLDLSNLPAGDVMMEA